ncbi:Hsp20/alpha crystallin family protein [Bacillus salitolerans]|uniref:Hsp20/alpha crystallin family protein n=1 Tax=Bacillus salitolerans TaxID=1437434 RepID=A0ABW4LRG3_9BACI
MKRNKGFAHLADASELLGEDFWDVMSDVLPYIGPRIDVVKTNKEMIIVVDAAGIYSKESLRVSIHGSMLVIEGEIIRPYINEEFQIIQDERFNGTFKRKIRLLEDCIVHQMKASYTKGLLDIRIPLYHEIPDQPQKTIPIDFADEYPLT